MQVAKNLDSQHHPSFVTRVSELMNSAQWVMEDVVRLLIKYGVVNFV
jgi:hypothetical protein